MGHCGDECCSGWGIVVMNAVVGGAIVVMSAAVGGAIVMSAVVGGALW